MWVVILFTLALAYAVYYCCFKPYNYWKNRGITYEIPLPVVGNFADTIFKRKHACQVYDYLYRKYRDERYVGIYIFMKPALLVRDLDLIKKICLEDFDHFHDRVKIFDKKFDNVIANNLGNLKGKEWKETRPTLHSTFSSLHLDAIFDSASKCAESFSNYFVTDSEDLLEIHLGNIFSRYECDVMLRVCFGTITNSLEDKNNEYFSAYKQLKSFGAFERLKLSLIQLCPVLAKIKVFPTSKTDFYKRLVEETIRTNEESNKVQNNLMQFIVNASRETVNIEKAKTKDQRTVDTKNDDLESRKSAESQKKQWNEEQLTAHALMFTNSHIGIEAMVSTISFMAYELALNPSVQVKLQEEIDTVQNSEDGLTYQTITQMKYLNCVVSESLRKWPPLYQTDRECVKNFFEVELSVPDDEKIVIEKNTAIIIPIMAIHRDPNYFPQPEKFSPERFNEENIGRIMPGSYIPFGRGPRKCIGSKLALLEIKLLFFHLLFKFDLIPTVNTTTRLETSPIHYKVNGAINTFLGLKPRKVTIL